MLYWLSGWDRRSPVNSAATLVSFQASGPRVKCDEGFCSPDDQSVHGVQAELPPISLKQRIEERQSGDRVLEGLREWSRLLDSAFRVPGTRRRFGARRRLSHHCSSPPMDLASPRRPASGRRWAPNKVTIFMNCGI